MPNRWVLPSRNYGIVQKDEGKEQLFGNHGLSTWTRSEVVLGVTSGADVEAFMLAYNIFIDGLQIIACQTNCIVHRTFWGTGMGQIDTKSTHKSGKHNVDLIPTKILSTLALKLRQPHNLGIKARRSNIIHILMQRRK